MSEKYIEELRGSIKRLRGLMKELEWEGEALKRMSFEHGFPFKVDAATDCVADAIECLRDAVWWLEGELQEEEALLREDRRPRGERDGDARGEA